MARNVPSIAGTRIWWHWFNSEETEVFEGNFFGEVPVEVEQIQSLDAARDSLCIMYSTGPQ